MALLSIESGGFDDLLRAARAGDERAMAALFRDVQPLLLRYLRARASEVADDLASEVWVGITKGIGRFVGDETKFRSWVFTIAHRRVADHRRRQARRRTEPVPVEELEITGPDSTARAIEELSAQEAVRRLVAGL